MINTNVSQYGTISNLYSKGDVSSKIEVPVPSSVSVYAQFKYVRGVPASSGQNPVSLSRAQIIDNMVSYLNGKTENPALNPDKEEFHIQELESEVYKVVNEEPVKFNTIQGQNLDKGLVFNLTA